MTLGLDRRGFCLKYDVFTARARWKFKLMLVEFCDVVVLLGLMVFLCLSLTGERLITDVKGKATRTVLSLITHSPTLDCT